MDALTKLNDILNNAPELEPAPEPGPATEEPTFPTETQKVTFDDKTRAPQIDEPIIDTPIPRVMKPPERKQSKPMHKVTIDKLIPNAQTPRLKIAKSNPKSNDNRERIRNYISSKTMARIPHRNSHL